MDALVPDDLWAVISPLLPPEPEKLKGGRPRASDRSALAGIILVLRTGMQWKHVPGNALGCSGKTSWRRLGEWQAAGVWANLQRVLLEQLQDANALNWSRAALDSASVPAKKGARRPARTQLTAASPAPKGARRPARTQLTAASPAPSVTSSLTPMGHHSA